MAPTPIPRVDTPTGFRAIYARNYFVKDSLGDIAYAFLDVQADGTVKVLDPYATGGSQSPAEDRGNLGQFKKLLKDQEGIGNLMISIGGWRNSVHFSDAFSTEERRTTFVNSLSQFLTDFPVFNGINIDWEYVSDNGVNYGKDGNSVSPNDGENFILVLQKLRDELPGYTLASCCNAAPEKNHWPIERAAELLDELHVMTYDGNWGGTQTAQHTNLLKSSAGKLWSVEEAAEFFLSQGVPASKIFIGGFANTTGIGQPASGASPHKSGDDGVVDYKARGSTEMWDDEGATAHRVDTNDNNVASILEKAKFIKEKKLGGIILWETAEVNDDNNANNNRSIMKALHHNLTHA